MGYKRLKSVHQCSSLYRGKEAARWLAVFNQSLLWPESAWVISCPASIKRDERIEYREHSHGYIVERGYWMMRGRSMQLFGRVCFLFFWRRQKRQEGIKLTSCALLFPFDEISTMERREDEFILSSSSLIKWMARLVRRKRCLRLFFPFFLFLEMFQNQIKSKTRS